MLSDLSVLLPHALQLAILKRCRHRHIIQFLGVAIKDSEVLLVTEVGSPFWQVCTSC